MFERFILLILIQNNIFFGFRQSWPWQAIYVQFNQKYKKTKIAFLIFNEKCKIYIRFDALNFIFADFIEEI
jgi:hypothetical protein